MEKETLLHMQKFCFFFCENAIVRENKGKLTRRKMLMCLIFQQEARRAHHQYHNLVTGLSLNDLE